MHTYKTIIVGGGVSGLGSASFLKRNGEKDFIVLAESLGGRVETSQDGEVNYGAYYARSDYDHLKPYLRFTRRIRPWKVCFIEKHTTRKLCQWRNIQHLPSFVTLCIFLIKVFRHARKLRENCLVMSQKEALLLDPFLHHLYKTPAQRLIHEKHWEFWAEHFINPIVWATAFVDVSQVSALNMCIWLFPLFTPSYEFHLELDHLIAPFKDHIRKETVTKVVKIGDRWHVQSNNGNSYQAHSLILATPIHITQKLVHIHEKLNPPVSVHMAHVRGKLCEKYQDSKFEMLDPRIDDIVITEESNGTFLFYSHTQDYDLHEYFETFEVITKKWWHPAFFIGQELIESNRGNDLYVIGDHNFCSMEDSFTTGIYAAHQVMALNPSREVLSTTIAGQWKTLHQEYQV